jgi:hypothetical protein
MPSLKRALFITAGLIFISSATFAQKKNPQQQQPPQQQQQPQNQVTSKDVSNKELKEFATTAKKVQKINRDSQQKLQKIVKKHGLNLQQFRKIAMSKKNPKMADSLHITKEEQKKYEKIQPELTKLQQKALNKFKKDIKDNGLTQKRFREIAMAMQSDKELQQRFQKMKMKQMKKSNGGGSQ